MHLSGTYKNSWNRKQNNVCVTLDSELYRRKPVLMPSAATSLVASVNSVNVMFGQNRLFECSGIEAMQRYLA